MHRDIENVINRYAWAADEGDLDALAGLLTGDARIEIPGQGVSVGPGPEAILEFFTKSIAARRERGQRSRHLISNIIVEATGDGTATARSYVAFVVTNPDGAAVLDATATYEDRLVEVDGGWRFIERRVIGDRDRVAALSA